MLSDLSVPVSKATLITDASGSIVWCNSVFRTLTGYNFNEVRGRNPRQLICSGVQGGVFYQSMWETILSGKVWKGRLVNRKKSGELYDDEMTIAPVFLDETHISHFIAVNDDVTALRQTERLLVDLIGLLNSAPLNGIECEPIFDELNGRAGFDPGEMGSREKQQPITGSRVASLSVLIATGMGMREEQSRQMQEGIHLYEIAKRSVPFHVVACVQPGDRRDRRWLDSSALGLGFPGDTLSLPAVLEIPHTHHERWDGGGFPLGLLGEEIPLATRIFNLADMWDALTSERYYTPPWQPQQAIEYLRKHAGSRYDPEVLEAFLDVVHLGERRNILNTTRQRMPFGHAGEAGKFVLVGV